MGKGLTIAAAAALFAVGAPAVAQGDVGACRAITDPAQRLACYDRAAGPAAPAGHTPPAAGAMSSPASAAASALPVPPPASREAERAAAPTQGRIASVTAVTHGYEVIRLDDGTTFQTTVVMAPPPVGAQVRIRRTVIGTTYLDVPGWSPIAVRRVRAR